MGNGALASSFCNLRRFSYTYMYLLISWASRISAVKSLKFYNIQSALLIHCYDADKKVFYRVT